MTATESNQTTHVILVDLEDNEIGTAEKLAAHQQNLLHRAFSVFIFQETTPPLLLLQQRASTKYHSPNLWTNTCCSHPHPGEDITTAAKRRLQEELGIAAPLTHLGWFRYNAHFPNGLSEHEIDHVFVGTIPPDTPIKPNPNEIQAYRLVTIEELEEALNTQPTLFTPWLKEALNVITRSLQKPY